MKIAIVGLGAAGMRAAMLLQAAGHDLELFEARQRLGGRMETTDHGGGVRYESGGEWIDSDHSRVLGLVRELGLQLDEPAGERLYIAHGSTCTEATLWPDAMEDQIRFEAAVRELCRNLRQPPWANTEHQNLDRATLESFIDQNAHSANGRWLLTAISLSDEGDDPDQIGLLGWLTFYLQYLQRQGGEMSAYRVQGGASVLFDAILKRLEVRPSFGKQLVRISQTPQGVTLEFADGTQSDADRAVLTLPPRSLERAIIEPALSPEKRCAVEACRMSRVIKICLEFNRAWWLDTGWSGAMQCDLAIQQTWQASSEAPVLMCYVCGRAAQNFVQLDDPIGKAMDDLSQLWPQAQAHFVRGWLHDWINDPYAAGGFSHVAPGYVLQHMAHIAPPEGLVHFAGEHTSLWTGFIEGALESAERVAQEIG